MGDIHAVIPASDIGGTSDAYLRIGYRVPKKSALARGTGAVVATIKDYTRTILVQKKVRCPALVKFKEKVEIPVTSYVGMLDKCEIEIMDKDKMNKDDTLIRHKVDLTFYFANGQKTQRVRAKPTEVCDIPDRKANAGFTKADIFIEFTMTLVQH